MTEPYGFVHILHSSEIDRRYENHRHCVCVIASCVIILGEFPHLIIVYSSFKRKKTDMWPFIMRIYSIACALNIFIGGLISNRHEFIDGYAIFLSYGLLGKFENALLCAVLDFFPTFFVAFSPIMIMTIMGLRYFIIRTGTICTWRTVYAVFSFGTIVALPLPIISIINYVDISAISANLTGNLLHETKIITAYAVKTNPFILQVQKFDGYVSGICVVIGLIFSYLNYHNVKVHISAMSRMSSDSHFLMYKVLGLELLVMFVYAFTINSQFFPIPESVVFFLNLLNYPIFAAPAIIQGYLTILILPSYRKQLRALFGISNEVHPITVVSKPKEKASNANVAELNPAELEHTNTDIVPC